MASETFLLLIIFGQIVISWVCYVTQANICMVGLFDKAVTEGRDNHCGKR